MTVSTKAELVEVIRVQIEVTQVHRCMCILNGSASLVLTTYGNQRDTIGSTLWI